MTRQPASQHGADACVEGVGQRRWIPARASEVREQASHEPDAAGRVQLEKELNARADAWHGDREGVVDLERPEDEEAPAPPAADLVRDDLAGLETRDRTEPPLAEVARGAEESSARGRSSPANVRSCTAVFIALCPPTGREARERSRRCPSAPGSSRSVDARAPICPD